MLAGRVFLVLIIHLQSAMGCVGSSAYPGHLHCRDVEWPKLGASGPLSRDLSSSRRLLLPSSCGGDRVPCENKEVHKFSRGLHLELEHHQLCLPHSTNQSK